MYITFESIHQRYTFDRLHIKTSLQIIEGKRGIVNVKNVMYDYKIEADAEFHCKMPFRIDGKTKRPKQCA